MFGLGNEEPKKKVAVKAKDAKKDKPAKSASQADEAKAMLAAMEQRKKDRPDDCVFC